MPDVLIVGAGPGGLLAAGRLAAAGFAVTVVEEHEAIGEPIHCTGVLAAEAFDEFRLPRAAVLNPLTTARFFAPSGRHLDYSTTRVEALVIDRRRFDADLCRAAEAAGARVVRGRRVTEIAVREREVAIELTIRARGEAPGSREALHGRACVLACGACYALQRRLGLGLPGLFLHSAQMEVPADRPGEVELHFGGDIAPKGFAWAVPVRRPTRDFVRIGVMCEARAPAFFQRAVGRVASRWGVRPDPAWLPRQKILPLSPIARTFGDRIVVVGDAAGLVKPTTGGGIYYSLVSGAIAADTLSSALAKDDLSARALADYEAGWKKRLAPELEAQLALRSLAERMGDAEIESLFDLARTDGIMPIVRRTARFNRHRNLIRALFKHPPAREVLFRRLVS